jgi:hypothetical protein
MRGQILETDAAGGGTILGSDGNRYSFARSDWKGPTAPAAGNGCDFIAGSGTAQEIFPLPGRASASSYASAQATAAPAVRRDEGSSQLLGILGILCLVLAFIVPVLPAIGGLILGLIGADSAKRHRNDAGLTLSRIAWIGSLIVLALAVIVILALIVFAWPLFDVFLQYVGYAWRDGPGTTA